MKVLKVLVQNPTHQTCSAANGRLSLSQIHLLETEITVLSFSHTLAYPEVLVPDCFQVSPILGGGTGRDGGATNNQQKNLTTHLGYAPYPCLFSLLNKPTFPLTLDLTTKGEALHFSTSPDRENQKTIPSDYIRCLTNL